MGVFVDHVKIFLMSYVEIKQREISWWETQQDAPQPFRQTDRSYVAQRTRIHSVTHTLNFVLVHLKKKKKKKDVAYVNKLWIYKEVWQVYFFQFWLSWQLVQIHKGAYTSSCLMIYSQVVVQGNIHCCTFTITHNGDIYPNLSHPFSIPSFSILFYCSPRKPLQTHTRTSTVLVAFDLNEVISFLVFVCEAPVRRNATKTPLHPSNGFSLRLARHACAQVSTLCGTQRCVQHQSHFVKRLQSTANEFLTLYFGKIRCA